MSALGTAGAMVTTHENAVVRWPFKGTKLFSFLQDLLEMKKNDGIRIMVLSAKFNFEFETYFWLVSSFWKLLFPFDWDLCGEYRQPIAQVGVA